MNTIISTATCNIWRRRMRGYQNARVYYKRKGDQSIKVYEHQARGIMCTVRYKILHIA